MRRDFFASDVLADRLRRRSELKGVPETVNPSTGDVIAPFAHVTTRELVFFYFVVRNFFTNKERPIHYPVTPYPIGGPRPKNAQRKVANGVVCDAILCSQGAANGHAFLESSLPSSHAALLCGNEIELLRGQHPTPTTATVWSVE